MKYQVSFPAKTSYLHMWRDHRRYGYIINRAFESGTFALVFHWCLYNKQNITCPLMDMNFISISHSFAALTREISSWPLEDKIHINARACNILYFFYTSPKNTRSELAEITLRTCFGVVWLIFPWCYGFYCLLSIEFTHKVTNLLQMWRIKLQGTKNLVTALTCLLHVIVPERCYKEWPRHFYFLVFWSSGLITGFNKWTKLFLNFFVRKAVHWMVKPVGWNNSHSQSICLALNETPGSSGWKESWENIWLKSWHIDQVKYDRQHDAFLVIFIVI